MFWKRKPKVFCCDCGNQNGSVLECGIVIKKITSYYTKEVFETYLRKDHSNSRGKCRHYKPKDKGVS